MLTDQSNTQQQQLSLRLCHLSPPPPDSAYFLKTEPGPVERNTHTLTSALIWDLHVTCLEWGLELCMPAVSWLWERWGWQLNYNSLPPYKPAVIAVCMRSASLYFLMDVNMNL